MRRACLTAGVVALVGVCAVGAPVAIATVSATGDTMATRTLAGSAAPVTSDEAGVGTGLASQSQTIEVWMAGHEHAAERFVDAVSTPGSPSYHQFLSPSAYTQRFGPSAAHVNAVKSYLTGVGFSRVQASVNDDYVSATAPESTINEAFSVQMRRYRITGPEGKQTTVESNDRELTVPASISSDILAVTGLNGSQPWTNDSTTATAAVTKAADCSQYWAQKQ